MKKILLLVPVSCALLSCASSPSLPPPKPVEVVVTAPVQNAPTDANTAPSAMNEVKAPQVRVNTPPKESPRQIFKLRRAKMLNGQPKAVLLSKTKNEKTPGVTTEQCWNYKHFSIVEMNSTDEVGAAELTLRRASSEHKNLCAREFTGEKKDLRIIEGHFAGIVGDYILIDGDESSEGILEFQIFDMSGREIFKARRDMNEDLVVTAHGSRVSLSLFAPIKVGCELAAEGEVCWQKTLAELKLPKTSMPDCKTAFAKANVPLTEAALVTIPAQISDLAHPHMKFLGGRSTCVPAP